MMNTDFPREKVEKMTVVMQHLFPLNAKLNDILISLPIAPIRNIEIFQ